MTDDELRENATTLILEHSRDIEYMTIFEMAEEHTGGDISSEDAKKVDALLTRATVMIRDELAVGDDSYHATPEAMRDALLAVLNIPVLTNFGAVYAIGDKLGLYRRSADVE